MLTGIHSVGLVYEVVEVRLVSDQIIRCTFSSPTLLLVVSAISFRRLKREVVRCHR